MVPSALPPDGLSASSSAGDGPSWQRYVNLLLASHFSQQGHEYVAVPAKVQGDGGIEGFSTTGEAFQAYCDEGSVNTADRARKQKSKITRDIAKLVDKDRLAHWKDLLQSLKLSKWHLVVPELEDKAVLIHARKKGEEARTKAVAHLTADFQATVVCADAFPHAVSELLRQGTSYLPVGYTRAGAADLSAFATAKTQQVAALDAKLKKLPNMVGVGALQAAREQILSRYLDAENLLARIRVTSPQLWEQIVLQRQEHAANLKTAQIFDVSPPSERVSAARSRFRDVINSLTRAQASTAAETLATGAIGLWMLECPLDFPEPAHV